MSRKVGTLGESLGMDWSVLNQSIGTILNLCKAYDENKMHKLAEKEWKLSNVWHCQRQYSSCVAEGASDVSPVFRELHKNL